MISAISLLAWVSEKDVQRFYSEKHQSLMKTKVDDIEKAKWRKHSLYKLSKEELMSKCVEKKLDLTGNKVNMVRRLSLVYPSEELDDNPLLYDGDLMSVPAGLNRLNVAQLREILRHHGILEDGVKEELVLRVRLLKGGREKAAFSRERISIIQAISFAEELFTVTKTLSTERVCRVREYSRCNESHYQTRDKPLLSIYQTRISSSAQNSECIKKEFEATLQPLKQAVKSEEEAATVAHKLGTDDKPYVNKQTSLPKEKNNTKGKSDKLSVRKSVRLASATGKTTDEFAKVKQLLTNIGTQVEVYWSDAELTGTNWESGWYLGEVQSYDEDEHTIHVMYEKEKTHLYSICIMAGLLEGIIRPVG
ncbi:Hypothetical predicted protein [Paramuricea clavata]|uniref:Uncharacterized protein n=1 Tax=Paramuricea clavata TaxID=317549 RepID=A0A7D9LCR0_PARCT|nr:Hypothetical predicted protein [Paramuricea clavata]